MAILVCPLCRSEVEEEDAIDLYECKKCGVTWSDDEGVSDDPTICPECNKKGALCTQDGCPECKEGELEELEEDDEES